MRPVPAVSEDETNMDNSGIVKGSPHETRQRIMAIVGAASGNSVEW